MQGIALTTQPCVCQHLGRDVGGDKEELTRKTEGVASRAGEKPGACSVLEANEQDFSRRGSQRLPENQVK